MSAVGACGQPEVLSVPADPEPTLALVAATVADERAVGVGLVPRVRKADAPPGRVVEIRLFGSLRVAERESPIGIEVVHRARGEGLDKMSANGRSGRIGRRLSRARAGSGKQRHGDRQGEGFGAGVHRVAFCDARWGGIRRAERFVRPT